MSSDYDPRQLAIAFLNIRGKSFLTERGYLKELMKSEKEFEELLKENREDLLKDFGFFNIR